MSGHDAPAWSELAVLVMTMGGAGILAGLIAGLFGVGGGTVLVPALFFAFQTFGFGGESSLHVAVGTSLSTIISTSLRSVAAHRKAGRVDEAVLRNFTPWIALGAILGAILAGLSDRAALGTIYAVIALAIAAHFGFGREDWVPLKGLPQGGARAATGTGIGIASAMMGLGGGALGSTLMTLAGRPIHQAVATASGFGVAIAIPATLGFIIAGWDAPGRPPLSAGYVNVPGFVVLALLTGAVAPYGARLAHTLNKTLLRRTFGAWLALTAAAVAARALSG